MSIFKNENPDLEFSDPVEPIYYFEIEQIDGKRTSTEQFYDFILTGFNEQHAESSSIKNVMSNTYLAFATGSQPIRISLSGYLQMYEKVDSRMDFIDFYNRKLRGTEIQNQGLVLRFYIKRTILRLYIMSINISYSAESQDMAQFSMDGIGSSYQINRFS